MTLNICNLTKALALAAMGLALPLSATPQALKRELSPDFRPELRLKRVTLSQAGIGYFEYEALVTGAATLQLSVKLDHVNDVLKSLVIYDGAGSLGGVSLPGKEPLQEAFKALPFDQSALSSRVAILRAALGTPLRVTLKNTVMHGRLMGIDTAEQVVPHGKVPIHRVSLSTGTGLQQFVLEDARNIAFADPVLRGQVESALQSVAANRGREGRTFDIKLTGQGQRTVRVGHVAPVPVWKTSYRLAVPPEGMGSSGTALLQGWAVVENLSGQDWHGVDLTLTSGRPVTFQQRLYDSVFNDRPTLPLDLPLRVLPRADSGVFGSAQTPVPFAAMAPAPAAPAVASLRSAPAAPFRSLAAEADAPINLSGSAIAATAVQQTTQAEY